MGFSALMRASYRGHAAVVRVLLEHDAEVDMQSDVGYSGFTFSCCIVEWVPLFIEYSRS